MDPHFAFHWAGMIAMLGWLLLGVALFIPALRRLADLLTRAVIPLALAFAYIILLAQSWGHDPAAGFGSIEAVRALFSSDAALAAGWLHYLAFDLFIGGWMAADALARGVHRFWLLPCLALTFLFGPAGLLLYATIRFLSARGVR